MPVASGALRESLLSGAPALGAWLSFSDALSAETMAIAGWDWLLVDMEHGPIALGDAAGAITAIRTTPVVPIVRPAWNESSQIQRALDLGCGGIVVPVINTADDARSLVRDARFPPLGERSRGGVRAQYAFGTDAMTYFERANSELIVLAQVETLIAVENVDAILGVEGLDGVFVGPNDLAASFGRRWPDCWDRDADYMEAVRRVASAARDAGKIAGFLARDATMARQVVEMGYRFVGVSSDVNYLANAAKASLTATRDALRR